MADIYRQDIWLINLNPPGKGREIFGHRPALIISDDDFNECAADLAIVLPVTSTYRNIPSHIKIAPPEGGVKKTSFIKCDQIRSISKERFIKKWGRISDKSMSHVEDTLRILLVL